MLIHQPPEESDVKKAFIRLVKEYNRNPIPEIKEYIRHIHDSFSKDSTIFYAFGNSQDNRQKIRNQDLSNYPEFQKLFSEFEKIGQEYSEYRISLMGHTGAH